MIGDGPITAREAEILRNEFKRVGRDADKDFSKMGRKVEELTKTEWTKFLIEMAKRPDRQKQEAGEHNAHSSEDRETVIRGSWYSSQVCGSRKRLTEKSSITQKCDLMTGGIFPTCNGKRLMPPSGILQLIPVTRRKNARRS